MSHPQMPRTIRHLLHMLRPPDSGEVPDAELLRRYVAARDDVAFELLVWRYAGMVFEVCCRVLHDSHDAEDAFQATFLVLARKAASIGRGEALGSWLHRVAFRVALAAQERLAIRRAPQLLSEDVPATDAEPDTEAAQRELRAVIDREINHLPERMRNAFVLCCVEGKSHEEAARQLGCPVGTVASRLARARGRLGDRLSRLGLTLAGGTVVELLVPRQAPAALISAAINTASRAGTEAVPAEVLVLTEGMMRTIGWMNLRGAAALLVLGIAGVGIGVVAQRGPEASQGPAAAPAAERSASPSRPTLPLTELHRLIKPRPGEAKWALIPWETNLQKARERAAREDKPLFVWRAGGGDVLGRA